MHSKSTEAKSSIPDMLECQQLHLTYNDHLEAQIPIAFDNSASSIDTRMASLPNMSTTRPSEMQHHHASQIMSTIAITSPT